MKQIELRSDTFTLPTDDMIDAIVQAHREGRLGDDVAGEDEVVIELQEKAARILGKEAALLVTSGTQGNVISLLTQARPGEEVVVERMSHTFLFEAGAMASLGGLFPKPVDGVRGYITPETLESVISPDNPHYARTAMVVIENTHNYAGGVIVPPDKMEALARVAHDHDMKIHCDGARLFNAAVALDIPASRLVKEIDSVQICLSKGLSAPIGSLVAGTEEFIHDALRVRKRLGGGMRQAGIIAAPGIVALEKMIDRLKEDHDNAQLFYKELTKVEGLVLNRPETNLLFIGLDNLNIDAAGLAAELKKRGVLVYGEYGERVRFAFNRMVSREDTEYAARAVVEILEKAGLKK
ncbi:MAG: aminotransferase class I/II-fold pyridoxal phosphate-dependent enzyme [Candidatus Thorarchaeota archaeon]|nr:aminotransferase class I/II-fold pyridoxal phosphate-dependent enzyme [Candidatus Thorarchaeota archaeon]